MEITLGAGSWDLTDCSNASEHSTIASRRSSSKRLFSPLSQESSGGQVVR
jgi:hypothetical protein